MKRSELLRYLRDNGCQLLAVAGCERQAVSSQYVRERAMNMREADTAAIRKYGA